MCQDHLNFYGLQNVRILMNSHTIITVECTSMQIANHPQTVNSLQDYVLCAGKATGFALGRESPYGLRPPSTLSPLLPPRHSCRSDRTAVAVWWCVGASQAALLVEQEDGRTWRRNTESPNHSRSPCAQGKDPTLFAVAPGPLTNTFHYL